MTKEIRLNAFDMNCVGHIQHGMWTHPRDRCVPGMLNSSEVKFLYPT